MRVANELFARGVEAGSIARRWAEQLEDNDQSANLLRVPRSGIVVVGIGPTDSPLQLQVTYRDVLSQLIPSTRAIIDIRKGRN